VVEDSGAYSQPCAIKEAKMWDEHEPRKNIELEI
jgi:hypothetical protein